MLTENIFPKKIWGPCAWHLLHIISIGNGKEIKKKYMNSYNLFYKTFGYIMPCAICSEHYKNLFGIFHKINSDFISREYLIKWTCDLHNIVNKNLKKDEYDLTSCINNNIIVNNKKIFFFVNNIFLHCDYNEISMYNYEQFYNFFINFCNLYPDKNIRKVLKKLISSKDFLDIETPREFEKWFQNNYKIWTVLIIKK